MVSEKKFFLDFLHYNPMGAICCHGNQSSNPIWTKSKCSLSPTPMMLQIKFGCDRWLRRYLCLKVLTHGRTHGRTDGRRLDWYTISSPCEPSAQVS